MSCDGVCRSMTPPAGHHLAEVKFRPPSVDDRLEQRLDRLDRLESHPGLPHHPHLAVHPALAGHHPGHHPGHQPPTHAFAFGAPAPDRPWPWGQLPPHPPRSHTPEGSEYPGLLGYDYKPIFLFWGY